MFVQHRPNVIHLLLNCFHVDASKSVADLENKYNCDGVNVPGALGGGGGVEGGGAES